MPEPVSWRHYPVGPLASLVRAVGSAVTSIPLIAILMILPFLAVWYVADKGAFGVDATGLAWSAWAELAVGIAVLAFVVGTLVASLLNLVRTVATLGGLRRVIRSGVRSVDVPHPQQWEMAAEWSGTSLIISSLITTAVLAFPGMLTTPVRTWVESSRWSEPVVLVGLPAAAIVLMVLYRLWRMAPLRELEELWSEELRSAAEDAASARVPNLPRDADGDLVNPATTHRRGLDLAGDAINSAGLGITAIAVITAAITLPVGTEMIGYGFASTATEALILLSSVLLLTVAIALYVLGAVLQNVAQSAELSSLLAAARRPHGPAPELSVLARYWKPLDTPWADFLGLVGALLLLLAVPALLMPGGGAAEGWGTVGGVVAVAALLAAAVVDVAAENSTREPRNLVMRRWPIPDPSSMNKKAQVDAAVEADVQGYGQRSDAHTWAPAAPAAPPPAGRPAAGRTGAPIPPPANLPYPPQRGPGPYPPPQPQGPYPPSQPQGPYPPSGAQGPYPPPQPPVSAGPPPPPPARPTGARRAWGLPKKWRGRGLGGLYR